MRILSKEELLDFLTRMDRLFQVPLSEKVNLASYAEKLLLKATLCPEMQDGELVGLVAGYTENIANNMAYIALVGVDKKLRRRGIAKKLITDFCIICRQKGIGKVHLYTDADNKGAINMYKNIGFEELVIENEPRPRDIHLILYFDKMIKIE